MQDENLRRGIGELRAVRVAIVGDHGATGCEIPALIADGTVAKLQRRWMTAHLDNLGVLR